MRWFTILLIPLLSALTLVLYQAYIEPFPDILPYSLPPPPTLTYNDRLQQAIRITHPSLMAPEFVTIHPVDKHILYTGCYDGSIQQITLSSTDINATADVTIRTLSYTGFAAGLQAEQLSLCGRSFPSPAAIAFLCGRPLGLTFRNDKELLIADAYHGLLMLHLPTFTYTVLYNRSQPDTNSLVYDEHTQIIYFTSASALFRNNVVMYDSMSGHCTGSLLMYSFHTQSVTTLVSSLCFPNGILFWSGHIKQQYQHVPHSKHMLIFAETNTAKLHSYDLGTQTHAIIYDNFPCLPDNLSWDKNRQQGFYWVGCGGPIRSHGRFSLYDFLGQHTWIRAFLLYTVPYSMLSLFVKPEAMIVRMQMQPENHEHVISDTWQDREGSVMRTVTSAVYSAYDNALWLTSFVHSVRYLGRIAWQPPG